MAQAGVYAPGSVIDADVVVRVNGVVREHVSMDWAGDTTGGLPEQVVSAGTGMRSRTGSIQWAQQDPVESEPPHPLRQVSAWPPREGDEVVIDAAVDTGQGPYQFRRFTGRLGRTTGSLTDGTLTSEITDTLGDHLQEVVSIPPHRSAESRRSFAVPYAAAEYAGLGVLPPPDKSTVGHLAGQGTIEPAVGVNGRASNFTINTDPYGLFVHTGLRLYPVASTSTADTLVMARAMTNLDSSVTAVLASGQRVTLTHYVATRTLALVAGAETVWTGPSTDDSPLPVLAFRIRRGGGAVVVYPGPGRSAVADASLTAGDGVSRTEGKYLIGQTIRMLTAEQAPAVVAARPRLPMAWGWSSIELDTMRVSRGFENVPARDVLDSWSEATLASYWMDEFGKPSAVARDVLSARSPVRTVAVAERLFSGSWSIGDDQVRSRVDVKGLRGALEAYSSTTRPYRAEIFQEQSARAFESEMTVERFIEAPTDTDWGPVDLYPSRYGTDPHSGNAPGAGTWVGAVSTVTGDNDSPELWAQGEGVNYAVQIERLGHRALKVTESIANVPAGKTVYLKSASERTFVAPAYRDKPSPTIRGEWKSTWADFTVTSAQRGPSWAPPLEHDSSWWLTPADAKRLADTLAAEVTTPMPTLSGVSLLWDPRRQIGDVEEWIATDSKGSESWRAVVLVTGYSETWDGNVPTQSVDVRAISITDPLDGKTYADLANAYPTYGDMAGTYQQVHDALPDRN